MKLIFLHITKTGGTTVYKNLLNPNLKTATLSVNDFMSPHTIKKIADADILHIHNPQGGSFFDYLGEKNFNILFNNSIVLTMIRDPIDRFESEWAFGYEHYEFNYPVVPTIQKDNLLDSKGELSYRTLNGFTSNPFSNPIDINQWVDFAFTNNDKIFPERHRSSLFRDKYEYNNLLTRRGGFSYSRNFQSSTISRHLGPDIFDKHLDSTQDLYSSHTSAYINSRLFFITTEYMDEMFAKLIYESPFFKKFTIFRDCNDSIDQLYNSIRNLKTNITDAKIRSSSKFRLNGENRYKYYLMNSDDYCIWSYTLQVNCLYLTS